MTPGLAGVWFLLPDQLGQAGLLRADLNCFFSPSRHGILLQWFRHQHRQLKIAGRWVGT